MIHVFDTAFSRHFSYYSYHILQYAERGFPARSLNREMSIDDNKKDVARNIFVDEEAGGHCNTCVEVFNVIFVVLLCCVL
jgi:hypothetical protein